MKKIKLMPVYISVLTVLIFVGALLAGMQSAWWITDGRATPLAGSPGGGGGGHTEESGEVTEEHTDEISEEDHETTSVSGSSTVQNALDLGITIEELEEVLQGEIEDTTVKIQDLVRERGLKFGEVKDALNALLND